MARKKGEDCSIKSSLKFIASLKSLASKSAVVLRKVKHKASDIISPKKKRKLQHSPKMDEDMSSMESIEPKDTTSIVESSKNKALKRQPSKHHHATVIEIGDNDMDETSEKDLGNSEDECSKQLNK